jgi:uncharacterized protein (TIGR03086 family)
MPIIVSDIRDLDRRAVEASLVLIRLIRPADLGRATPCGEWSLGDLLAHLTAQHRGFRAASLGDGHDLAHWTPVLAPSDPVAAYERAARGVLDAFGRDGVLERSFALPEISTDVEFPAVQAIGFHFIDYVVHGWDVARALGEPYLLADELAAAALRIAELVPDGPERSLPAAAFRPSLPVDQADQATAESSALDRILRLLGRSPSWPNSNRS